ncbi:MAG: hypothetical protein IT186_16285, partial [Acidobacteria bacterium]|nr:hypothetical protein [Acidobacteriota bacterium]
QDTKASPTLDATAAAFKLTLVDGQQQVVPEGEFLVHVCPRFDHESAVAPRPCEQAPTRSANGIIETVSTLPGWGYLGIELTKAPVAPGTYYVRVESIGQTHRIRIAADRWDEAGGVANEFAGSFGVCHVAGGEFLDENFQRVNPIEIEAPTRGYVRMILPGSPAASVQRKLRTETLEGAIVTPNVDVTLNRLGQSSVYLAEFTLMPEDYTPSPNRATLAGTPPQVTASLGANNAILTTPQGQEETRCGVDDPAKLIFKFVKRDGSALTESPDPADPARAGEKQETEIGDTSDNHAEIIHLEIQAVSKADPKKICTNCNVSVGLTEKANDKYSNTKFFGLNGSTKLEGKIDGEYRTLQDGRVIVTVKSVADVRLVGTTPYPAATQTGVPAYAGADGARIKAVAGSNSRMVKDGDVQTIALWGDERSNKRRRGDAAGPANWVPAADGRDAPNGARDWLEKKLRDFYAEWAGDSEIIEGMKRVDEISETNDSNAGFQAQTSNGLRVAGKTTTANMTWKLWGYGNRRPLTSAERSRLNLNFDQAGFKVDPAADVFAHTAIHEARHAWQYTMTDSASVTDSDLDFAPDNPPSSALVLRDNRYSLTTRDGSDGLNPEYDFVGDPIADFDTWGSYGTNGGEAAREADAIRTSGKLANSNPGWSPGCLGSNGYSLQLAKVGFELRAQVSYTKTGGTSAPYAGAPVIFEVVSGNMLLSENVVDFTPPPSVWNDPCNARPECFLRISDPRVVSSARYNSTDPGTRKAESRALVVPPPAGASTATTVKATLVLPPECAAAGISGPSGTTTVTPSP